MHALQITLEDHITYQLYEASTNPMKKKSRRNSFLYLLAIGAFIVFVGYREEKEVLFYYGIAWFVLILCFGNLYLKWFHKRHYTKYVKNTAQDVQDDDTKIAIGEEHIRTMNSSIDITAKISDIKTVNEIQDQYFIKLSSGPVLIIPKKSAALNAEVEAMIQRSSLVHVKQLDWKW